jgi:predicted kinase
VTGLVVVTGPPGVDVTEVAAALAEQLGCAHVSVAGLQDELAQEAEDTPRDWLRLDAESELKRRIELFGTAVVIDVTLADPAEAERLAAVLRPWWAGLVEVRCEAPDHPVASLGAARTIVLDGALPPSVADLAAVVRDETPRARRTRRH